MSRGATPAGSHRPIAVGEILAALDPRPGQVAVDCTLGYGGHASELLRRVLPGGRLFAFDVDPLELPKAEARLRRVLAEAAPGAAEAAVVCTNCNYAGAAGVVLAEVPEARPRCAPSLPPKSRVVKCRTRRFLVVPAAPRWSESGVALTPPPASSVPASPAGRALRSRRPRSQQHAGARGGEWGAPSSLHPTFPPRTALTSSLPPRLARLRAFAHRASLHRSTTRSGVSRTSGRARWTSG